MPLRINDNPQRSKEDRQNVEFLYIITVMSGVVTLNADVSQIVWFDKDNLPAEEAFASDHREAILRYFVYVEKPFPLPILG